MVDHKKEIERYINKMSMRFARFNTDVSPYNMHYYRNVVCYIREQRRLMELNMVKI